jgi:hypothetical protein
MNITEIKNYNWVVSDDLKITKMRLKHIEAEEQELHINIAKEYETSVCCSYQKYLTKLSKTSLCCISEVLVSEGVGNDGYVLQISGTLDNKGISIRKRQANRVPKAKQQNV